jgi:hypothetical protein
MTGVRRKFRRELARNEGYLKHRDNVSKEERNEQELNWTKADKLRYIEQKIYTKKRIDKGRNTR